MTWYGFSARVNIIWHKIIHPTHNVKWRVDVGKECDGDIVCETCDTIYWCRLHDLSTEELNKRLQIRD